MGLVALVTSCCGNHSIHCTKGLKYLASGEQMSADFGDDANNSPLFSAVGEEGRFLGFRSLVLVLVSVTSFRPVPQASAEPTSCSPH